MTEFGIWSDTEDGFIETGMWSREEARKRLYELVAECPDDALTVEEICPDHEEQPKLYCDECKV